MSREPKLANKIQDILKTNHLLSAGKIKQFLHSRKVNCNKTSVYRALDQLLDKGVVCQHYFKDAQAQYELREDHHTHLVCEKCGKVSMMECNYDHDTHPKNHDGFKIDHHHITLLGICKNCL